MRNQGGFTWNALDQAAQYCAQYNTHLDEGLKWADDAINSPVGEKNFQTLSVKAQILVLLGKKEEADALMKEALPLGKVGEVHQYARQLLVQKRTKDAFETFKANYDRHPNEFTTNMGMARGYSAMGEYKKSLDYARKALAQAPDNGNKTNIENAVKSLQEGKDIN